MKCGNENSNESLPNAKVNSIRKRMLIPSADSVNKENKCVTKLQRVTSLLLWC